MKLKYIFPLIIAALAFMVSCQDDDTKTFTPSYSLGQTWYASIGVKYIFN